jgi:hypothetical protein
VNEELFTAVLALAWFGAVNLAVSAAVAGAAWMIERNAVRLRPAAAPAVLLGLKLLPGAASVFFTLLVFLPAHWRFEPKDAQESLGYTLGALGALGALTLVVAGRRAIRDTRLTRSLAREWEGRASGPSQFLAGVLPVYCLPDAMPIISLAGFRRPRVFVARPVMDAFSADELDVSLAHELAHHDTHDNVKRVLVACSPDLLAFWLSGRRLEHRWRAAVEFAADARAVRGSDERAVSLASALLKVARLAPAAGALLPGSAFYDGTLLWARIDRLLAPAESPLSPRPVRLGWSVSIAGMTVLAAVAAAQGAWLGVHVATEGLVRFLP